MGRSRFLATLAVAALLLSPALSRAEAPVSVGLWGGWARMGMGDINTVLQSQADGLKEMWGASADLKKPAGGWQAGAEATMEALPGFALGVRTGWLSPTQGKVKAAIDDSRYAPLLVATGESLFTVESWGVPFLAGGRYIAPIDEGINFSAGLFMGYGITGMRFTEREDLLMLSTVFGERRSLTDYAIEAGGGAFVWEMLVGVSWLATPQVAVGVDAGYRHFTTTLRAGKDADVDNDGGVELRKGDLLKDSGDKPVEMDLSGVFFTLSLSYLP